MGENEVWKDVAGYEGRYQVSNAGRVKSLGRVTELNGGRRRVEPEVIMKYTLRSGYPTLILRRPGERRSAQIHRLVAQAFLPNPDGLPVVNHIDFDPTNNRVENLEWCTTRDNVRHSAERMSHPKSKSAATSTGEKYIRKAGKSYRVCVKLHGKRTSRSFKSLQDAVAYRNEAVE